MNKEFDWNGLREISGFGGYYEASCRRMARHGVEWLRENKGQIPPCDKTCKEYYGGKAFQDWYFGPFEHAVASACEDCTGAMVGAASNHAYYIFSHGWETYVNNLGPEKEDSSR